MNKTKTNMKVLFVCTEGKHRSRTAAEVYKKLHPKTKTDYIGTLDFDNLSKANYNYAALEWADIVYVMEECHKEEIIYFTDSNLKIYVKIKVLEILDIYSYNQTELIAILKEKLKRRKNDG